MTSVMHVVNVSQAGIETANDYTKKSFVFRLHVTDGSEFLFAADTQVSHSRLYLFIIFYLCTFC
jgi:hypothetical protein